jgi:colicin import membrane protein
MKTEIVKINPSEFGLTEETALNIQAQFQPMLEKMSELENEFNEVVSLPIDDLNTSKVAKELRLKYVKIRTATASIHKIQKEFYLSGGRFVDGWKNAQIFASQGKEEKLEAIEKHLENLEKTRLFELNEKRKLELSIYVEDVTGLVLSGMDSDVWEAYFQTKKKNYEDKIAAEKEAERLKLEAELKEKERIEAQRIENEKLKLEAEKREKEIEAERLQAKKEAELKAAEIERERREIEAKNQEALKIEREKQIALEKELQAKKEAELKAEKERQEKELQAKKEAEKLAKAPLKKQLTVWVNLFESPICDVEHDKKTLILQKFELFKKWAVSEIENI